MRTACLHICIVCLWEPVRSAGGKKSFHHSGNINRGRALPAACLGCPTPSVAAVGHGLCLCSLAGQTADRKLFIPRCSWVDGLVLRAGYMCTAVLKQATRQNDPELTACAPDVVSILMLLEQAWGLGRQAASMGLPPLVGQAVQQLTVRGSLGC